MNMDQLNELKLILYSITMRIATSPIEQKFIEAVENELQKVSNFYKGNKRQLIHSDVTCTYIIDVVSQVHYSYYMHVRNKTD